MVASAYKGLVSAFVTWVIICLRALPLLHETWFSSLNETSVVSADCLCETLVVSVS